MKCYLVVGKAYTQDYALLTEHVFKIFSDKNNAIKYIRETWPEAKHVFDGEFGEYYTFGPDDNFSWIAKYFIEERTIEDL